MLSSVIYLICFPYLPVAAAPGGRTSLRKGGYEKHSRSQISNER